jgi:hypothetical protein
MGRILLGVLLLAACGTPSSVNEQPSASCDSPTDGKLFVIWTLRGLPADATACNGISKMAVELSPDQCAGSVEIAPVPCERDGKGWRYDNLPRGGGYVRITAYDLSSHPMMSGYARVDVEPDLPAAPASVALN